MVTAHDHGFCRPFPFLCFQTRKRGVSSWAAAKGGGLARAFMDPEIVVAKLLSMAEGGVSGVVVGVSFDEQLFKFSAHLLDVPCADAHLVQLTECFSEWQTRLSTSLQLTVVEVEDIESDWPRNAKRQRLEMFRRWKNKLSSQATYRSAAT